MSSIAEQIISQQNIANLCGICERFFLEKYKVNVTQDTLNKTIPILLNKIIKHYTTNPPLPNVQEINKIAMQQMKDFVLSKVNKQQQQQQQDQVYSPLPPPVKSADKKPIDIFKYDPNDLYKSESVDKQLQPLLHEQSHKLEENVTEDDFFLKLQDLENFRKNSSIVKNINPDMQFLTQQNPVNTNNSEINKIHQPIIIQQVATNSPIARVTKSIIINAASHRDWIYFHERTMFIWPGLNNNANAANPANPANPETSYTSTILLKQLLLPRRVAKNTPVVILEITGASNKSVELVCILNTPGVNWDSWKCVNDGAIQNMSYPWTIKLVDENKNQLSNLGKDGSVINSVSILYNNNTQLTLEPHMNCIEIGTQLKIYKNNHINENKTYIFNVVNINGKNIEVEGNAMDMVDGIVCNLGYQPYIILDL